MNNTSAACAIALAATAFAWQIRAQESQRPSPDAACLARLLQSSQALALYARDNDLRFPPANEWNDALAPLLPKPEKSPEAPPKNEAPSPRTDPSAPAPKPESPFDCPLLGAGGWGYSMNWKLSKRQSSELDEPARTVALYETNVPRENANFDGRDLISRHTRQLGGVDGVPASFEPGGNVAFADGSVSWLPADTAPNFRIFLDNKPRPQK